MLADLRSMLETDWNDERPELTFFCQGGDGRAYQVGKPWKFSRGPPQFALVLQP